MINVINLDDIRRNYRDEILQIAEKYHADNVRVFGSLVRGEASVGSDIDIVVHFKEGASLFDESGLDIELNELLPAKVDLISDRAIRKEFYPFIMDEAEPL